MSRCHVARHPNSRMVSFITVPFYHKAIHSLDYSRMAAARQRSNRLIVPRHTNLRLGQKEAGKWVWYYTMCKSFTKYIASEFYQLHKLTLIYQVLGLNLQGPKQNNAAVCGNVTREIRRWWDYVEERARLVTIITLLYLPYLYTAKVASISAVSRLYLVMILRQYDVTNISLLAARIQPAPRYLAPMRHIRGKSVQRLRPCVRSIFI
jgi:hypothetical protein